MQCEYSYQGLCGRNAGEKEYQGNGIGGKIVEFTLNVIRDYKKINQEVRVYLGASKDKEAFYEKYDNFVAGLTRDLNEKLWEKVEFIHDERVTTSSFFTIYDKYF